MHDDRLNFVALILQCIAIVLQVEHYTDYVQRDGAEGEPGLHVLLHSLDQVAGQVLQVRYYNV